MPHYRNSENALKPDPQPHLYLPLPVEVSRIDIQRLAKRRGVGLQPGEEVQRGQGAGWSAGINVIAGRFQLRHVLVVEKVEALGQQLQLPHLSQVEALAQPQVRLPRCRAAPCRAPRRDSSSS